MILGPPMQPTVQSKDSSPHIRNIALDIILGLITCYLYNTYVQYVQIKAVNEMLGTKRYDFIQWSLLTLITCGLYHVYHEYRMTTDLAKLNGESGSTEALIAIVLTLFGLSIVVDAIQQSHINRYFGSSKL